MATVEWLAIHGDGDTKYDGYISTDGGLTWDELFKGVRGTNKYSWVLDADMTGDAEVLVEGNGPFGVAHAKTQRFRIDGVAVDSKPTAPATSRDVSSSWA